MQGQIVHKTDKVSRSMQGCKNVTILITPKMVIRTFLSSYMNTLMDKSYMILKNCLFYNTSLCNLGVFTPNLYSLNLFWALNTTQMGQICYFFLNLPIEVKPSLVPLVPRYLSFCNPVWLYCYYSLKELNLTDPTQLNDSTTSSKISTSTKPRNTTTMKDIL